MEILRKNQEEILGIKNTATETKNHPDELFSALDTAEERLAQLEDISIETAKPEKRKKD